jgi:hypothetical protein
MCGHLKRRGMLNISMLVSLFKMLIIAGHTFLFFFFGGAGVETQGFILEKQRFYHLSPSSNPGNVLLHKLYK